ncbi:MAG: DMT family transporter [Pseudomonadota bacterium]
MSPVRVCLLTSLALLAFAANSLLCRAALAHTQVDAATFTGVRLVSGAIVLAILVALRGGARTGQGSWPSALALFGYAAGFSFSYVRLPASAGALILFGAVQASMIAHGLWKGERLLALQLLGLVLAGAGLIGLMLPGLSAPPLPSAVLMLGAGMAWGVYTLRGKGAGDPLKVTAGNFIRTVPMAIVLGALLYRDTVFDLAGMGYAVLSGALASGLGYAIWYAALPQLRTTTAATVQLSVPVIAAAGAVFMLGEPVSARLLAASLAILGGIALVILKGKRAV